MYGTGNLGEVVQPLPDADVAKTTDNGVEQSNWKICKKNIFATVASWGLLEYHRFTSTN